MIEVVEGSVPSVDTSRPLGNVKALQTIAEILYMEQLGEISQRVHMLLELARRHEK